MPVEPVRPGSERIQSPTTQRSERQIEAEGEAPFRAQLQRVQGHQADQRLGQALAEVDRMGMRLAERVSMVELKRYRQAVAVLLKELTAQTVQVEAGMEWDSRAWEHRTMVILRKVDEEMEHLTEQVLSQEQDRLAILERIGLIKGLLLDLRI